MSRCNLVKILLPLLLLVAPLAQANIGKVIYVAGPVTVERGETLELKKGDMLLLALDLKKRSQNNPSSV